MHGRVCVVPALQAAYLVTARGSTVGEVQVLTMSSVDYEVFDSARRKLVRAWWREFTDPEELATRVARLQVQAAALTDEEDRARAYRYLKTLDDLVCEARSPESETGGRAEAVLLRAGRPASEVKGSPIERIELDSADLR
ncbi:hypothetical protein ABZX12_41030 [Kribbella sp. NPDC003505]|uniref:hypothetical protein n=1 Tax=Kribbella sp. NPDC003505 TaxID=3154448 RepID=UPI0033B0086E